MQQGRCEAAVDGANKGLADGDPKAYFLVGMMHLKGLCIAAAPERAIPYFEPAAKAGHVHSAYMLAMMHGLGTGAAQSYAQAGRWTVAIMDIGKQGSGRAASAPAGPIDANEATAMGVMGTIAAIVRDRLLYPMPSARLSGASVSATLRLNLGPQGLRHEVADSRSAMQDDVASATVRRSNLPHREALEEVVADAIRELPPFPTPERSYDLSVTYVFNLRYR